MEFRQVPTSDARWVAHEADVSVDQARAALVIADGMTNRAIDIAQSTTPPAKLSKGEVKTVSNHGGVSLDEARAILSTTEGNLDLAKEIASGVPRDTTIPDADIEIVAQRVDVSYELAEETLHDVDGDLAAAVERLENRPSRPNQQREPETSSDTEIWDPE